MLAKLLFLAPAVLAVPMAETINPVIPSIVTSVGDLVRVVARVNVFTGNRVDIKQVTREARSVLATVEDIANEISESPRYDEIQAASVIGALPPIFVQLDLLSQALDRKRDDIRNPAFLEEGPGLIDTVADTANDLASAVNAVAPPNWYKVFHDVNDLYLNRIRNLRSKVNPRPYVAVVPYPVPVGPAAGYNPAYEPTYAPAGDYAAPAPVPGPITAATVGDATLGFVH